jgi:hypothetical protein
MRTRFKDGSRSNAAFGIRFQVAVRFVAYYAQIPQCIQKISGKRVVSWRDWVVNRWSCLKSGNLDSASPPCVRHCLNLDPFSIVLCAVENVSRCHADREHSQESTFVVGFDQSLDVGGLKLTSRTTL